ncbi:MAG: hypothetical protein IJ770_00290 [Alphaproteobacteria bacterium]|nr:hypothetical protein [Alphaproteobacteria bacterium]
MWFIYVILGSLFSSAYYFGNQVAKIKPHIFMFYRGIVPAVAMFPLVLWVEPVANWQFYVFCTLQGCVISFIDYRNFRAMRVWGAEAVSALHPLSIGVVFLLWLLIKPYILLNYMDNLWKFSGILLALTGVIYATFSFGKARNSRKLLYYMVPYFFGAATVDVINKVCMSYAGASQLKAASIFYIMITGLVVAVVNFTIFKNKTNKINELFNKNNLKYSPIILLLIGFMTCKNFAMFNVSNPAFVMATLYIYILWIMLVGQIKQIRQKLGSYRHIEYKKAFILLFSAIVLVLLEN